MNVYKSVKLSPEEIISVVTKDVESLGVTIETTAQIELFMDGRYYNFNECEVELQWTTKEGDIK